MTSIHIKQHVAELIGQAVRLAETHHMPIAKDIKPDLDALKKEIEEEIMQDGQAALARQLKAHEPAPDGFR